MDAKTLGEAFGVEVEDDEAEIDETESDEAEETSFDSDLELAYDSSAPAADRREAFIRAVKAAAKL